MLPILNSIFNLATSYIDGRTSVKKAEAQTQVKIATGEMKWNHAAMLASQASWKDEAWTICFISIVVASFVPSLQPYIAQGFKNLEEAPSWFQAAMGLSIAASFGKFAIKGLKKQT